MKNLVVISLLCLVVGLSACGGGDSAATTQSTKPVASSHRSDAPALPKVRIPSGPPPKKLVVKDLKVGQGGLVNATDAIVVAYEGVGYKTGKAFDRRTRSEPFFFQTGVGRVMPGFDKGVVGMKVGGQRELIVPPDLTLEELGKPETLVYVIELLHDESAAEYKHRLATGESLPLYQYD